MTELLKLDNVSKVFHGGLFRGRRQVAAVRDVSFALSPDRPEIFTIIGESGSGKTTLARMILGLERPSMGSIDFNGQPISSHLGRRERLGFMSKVQPVFQNPFEAFNPLKQVDRYLRATARLFGTDRNAAGVDAAIEAALVKVGLSFEEVRGRFPHELSGGQLQRVAIARALIPNPSLLIADEPVSMVDASLRMAIVNLLRSLRDDFGVSVIYITHDLATAYYISDRLIIMQKGRVVEMGPARSVLGRPEHAYSRLLRASVLSAEDAGRGRLEPSTELLAESEALLAIHDSHLVSRPDGRQVRVYG